MKTVAIFVDVQNIYYTTKQAYQCHFDYSQFWKTITRDRTVTKAFAYAIDKGDVQQIKFQKILQRIGFELKLKPYIERRDGSAKGDWDVGITVDMLDYAAQTDIIVLASGDGDFDLAIDKIRQRDKVRAEVYGVPTLTANSLIKSASQFFPIEGKLLLNPKK